MFNLKCTAQQKVFIPLVLMAFPLHCGHLSLVYKFLKAPVTSICLDNVGFMAVQRTWREILLLILDFENAKNKQANKQTL